MKRLNLALALALAAAALLALSGIAIAKDRHGDHDGRHHHHDFPLSEGGTVSSFDTATGKLTIALSGGETVTGLVTGTTRIDCEGVDDRLRRRDHGGDENGGQNEPGDDNGGEAPAGESACSTASLTAGEIVGSAELHLEGGAAVFDEIELGFHS